jgi:hypothetical protein
VRASSRPWRCRPCRRPGSSRRPRRWRSRAPLTTSRSRPEPPGPPMGLAQTAAMSFNRGSCVWGGVALAASLGAEGGGMGTGVIVWQHPWRWRHGSPGDGQGSAGVAPTARPRGAAPSAGVWSRGLAWCPWCHAPVLSARSATPGGNNKPPSRSGWRSRGGPRLKRLAAGTATACPVRWRWNSVMGVSPRRHCAALWGMRVNWPSSTRRPRRAPKRRKPQRWPTTSRGDTRSGWRACRTRKRLEPRRRGAGRGGAGGGLAPGASTRCAITAWPTPAARAGPSGDAP